MDFSVVTSVKDGDYDPIVQYKWNQDHGFVSHDYALLLNRSDETYVTKQNFQVQESMNNLRVAILDLIEDSESNWDKFANACETAGNILYATPIFTKNSSDSIIGVIDALVKLENFGEVSDHWEYIWEPCLDKVIISPACPRPVLWRIVDEIVNGEGFNYMMMNESSSSSAVIFTLCKNPILGDNLISPVIFQNIASGNFSCILNPSTTLKSLEKINISFLFYAYFDDVDSLIGKFLREIPTNLLNLPANIRQHPDLEQDYAAAITVAEYVVFASRLIIELKLGRCEMKDLEESPSQYVKSLAQLLNAPSENSKDELIPPFVSTLNKRTEDLIREMYTK